jgi:hypothetical protein
MKPARKGEVPTIDWAQWVERTLRRLIDVPPPRQRPITGGSGDKPPFWTTISRVPESDPPTYQVAVTLGYLTYQQATFVEEDDGVVGWIAPMIEGENGLVSLEPPSATAQPSVPPWEAPKLELPGVQSYVYLRVKTDKNGAPKLDGESVTIEAFTDEQEDVHHIRASPSGGEEEGDYFFLILETESNGADPAAPIARRRITGNRHMPNQLIEITNIQEEDEDGEIREIYEGYDPGPEDKHKLRTLVQIEAEGEPLIKPVPSGEDPPKSIPFRRVKANESQGPQVNVSSQDDGDTIQIEGNGFSQPYQDLNGGGVFFQDGLATSIIAPEEGDGGANFNAKLLNVKITETGGEIFVSSIGWGTDDRFWYVRNGLLFLADPDGANVPVYDVISRIEGESDPSTSGESGPGLTPAA